MVKAVLPTILLVSCVMVGAGVVQAQNDGPTPPIIGRWDLTIQDPSGRYPSWLEVTLSGYKTLVGQFVGHFGSARPIGEVLYTNGKLHFSIPVQWERRPSS